MKCRLSIVTEHTLVRYLELVVGIDVEALRRDIARIVARAEDHDGLTAILKDGMRYVIDGGKVVTVRPETAR